MGFQNGLQYSHLNARINSDMEMMPLRLIKFGTVTLELAFLFL